MTRVASACRVRAMLVASAGIRYSPLAGCPSTRWSHSLSARARLSAHAAHLSLVGDGNPKMKVRSLLPVGRPAGCVAHLVVTRLAASELGIAAAAAAASPAGEVKASGVWCAQCACMCMNVLVDGCAKRLSTPRC